jgi:hypothetical protein
MKKTDNSSNRIAYLIGIGMLVLIGTGYFLSKGNDRELDEFGVLTEGVVTQIQHRINRGEFVQYEYFVNSKKYTYQQQIEGEVKIGDKFGVIYSSKNPEKSKILFDNPIRLGE